VIYAGLTGWKLECLENPTHWLRNASRERFLTQAAQSARVAPIQRYYCPDTFVGMAGFAHSLALELVAWQPTELTWKPWLTTILGACAPNRAFAIGLAEIVLDALRVTKGNWKDRKKDVASELADAFDNRPRPSVVVDVGPWSSEHGNALAAGWCSSKRARYMDADVLSKHLFDWIAKRSLFGKKDDDQPPDTHEDHAQESEPSSSDEQATKWPRDDLQMSDAIVVLSGYTPPRSIYPSIEHAIRNDDLEAWVVKMQTPTPVGLFPASFVILASQASPHPILGVPPSQIPGPDAGHWGNLLINRGVKYDHRLWQETDDQTDTTIALYRAIVSYRPEFVGEFLSSPSIAAAFGGETTLQAKLVNVLATVMPWKDALALWLIALNPSPLRIRTLRAMRRLALKRVNAPDHVTNDPSNPVTNHMLHLLASVGEERIHKYDHDLLSIDDGADSRDRDEGRNYKTVHYRIGQLFEDGNFWRLVCRQPDNQAYPYLGVIDTKVLHGVKGDLAEQQYASAYVQGMLPDANLAAKRRLVQRIYHGFLSLASESAPDTQSRRLAIAYEQLLQDLNGGDSLRVIRDHGLPQLNVELMEAARINWMDTGAPYRNLYLQSLLYARKYDKVQELIKGMQSRPFSLEKYESSDFRDKGIRRTIKTWLDSFLRGRALEDNHLQYALLGQLSNAIAETMRHQDIQPLVLAFVAQYRESLHALEALLSRHALATWLTITADDVVANERLLKVFVALEVLGNARRAEHISGSGGMSERCARAAIACALRLAGQDGKTPANKQRLLALARNWLLATHRRFSQRRIARVYLGTSFAMYLRVEGRPDWSKHAERVLREAEQLALSCADASRPLLAVVAERAYHHISINAPDIAIRYLAHLEDMVNRTGRTNVERTNSYDQQIAELRALLVRAHVELPAANA
jgi:hypothetical protein